MMIEVTAEIARRLRAAHPNRETLELAAHCIETLSNLNEKKSVLIEELLLGLKRLITTSLKIKNVLEDANTEFSTDASNRIQNGPTEDKYKIVRFFRDDEVMNGTVVKTGLSLKEAQAHCKDPETSSGTATSVEAKMRTDKYGPWFEGYTKE